MNDTRIVFIEFVIDGMYLKKRDLNYDGSFKIEVKYDLFCLSSRPKKEFIFCIFAFLHFCVIVGTIIFSFSLYLYLVRRWSYLK